MPAWVLEGWVLDMLWVDVCAVVSMTVICSLMGDGIMDGVKINPVCGINDSRATQSGGQTLNKADSTSIPACLSWRTGSRTGGKWGNTSSSLGRICFPGAATPKV
jgi:hypothetical protein